MRLQAPQSGAHSGPAHSGICDDNLHGALMQLPYMSHTITLFGQSKVCFFKHKVRYCCIGASRPHAGGRHQLAVSKLCHKITVCLMQPQRIQSYLQTGSADHHKHLAELVCRQGGLCPKTACSSGGSGSPIFSCHRWRTMANQYKTSCLDAPQLHHAPNKFYTMHNGGFARSASWQSA